MSVKPINYDIVFEPNLTSFTFSGKEKITVDINGITDRLVLNAVDMKIKSCRVGLLSAKTRLNEKKEELEIILPKKIKGKAEIYFEFEGILNDKLAGFYRSKYTVDGKEKYLATTQFEAADARRAFPCWDSPEQKATFDISFVIDKSLTAVSNMPIIEEKVTGDKKFVKFDRTPIMSTYLVYLGVGEFESIESMLGKVKIRVMTTPGKISSGKLALDYAKRFLDFYQKYFKIDFPLPKIDFIALPDFASGAMENWGAITFREAGLLYDEKLTSTATKQYIAEVVSHELAHQWFGDLVTMEWWNDLWLNESFATFMANKSVDIICPEWEFDNQFLDDSVSRSMSLDSLKSSHPIEVQVKTPAEISEIFDEISYDKGGSILRMLEDFLGEDVFRDGLRKYLSDHKYGNATTQDLWAAFEQVSGKPVKRMMNVWIKQVGYPIVTWEGSELVQGRFMHEGVSDSIWPIPLSIKTDQKRISQLMDKKRIKFDVDGKWVKLNFGQKGYYRVQYTDGMLEKLKGLIENKKLPSVDRWGIENDMYALCAANKMPASKYLEIIKWYWNDDDYLVCHDIEDGLYAIYLLSSKERFWPEVKAYSREYLTHVISRLGWEPGKGEKHTDALLRSSTILQLGRVDDKKALSFASKKFDAFMKDNDSLHADLRGIVYSLTAWQGDRKTYGTLKDLYIKSTTQEEKRRFLSSMSGFRDEKLLLKTLDFSLSPQVRVQDTFVPIAIAAANPYSRDILWPWIKENWGELHERYSVAKNLLGRIIDTVSILADDKKEAEVRKFFEQHPAKGTEMTVRQMLERLKINARFVENLRQSYSV